MIESHVIPVVNSAKEVSPYGDLLECLDWQNSQFINIVGKDDNSAAIEVK